MARPFNTGTKKVICEKCGRLKEKDATLKTPAGNRICIGCLENK